MTPAEIMKEVQLMERLVLKAALKAGMKPYAVVLAKPAADGLMLAFLPIADVSNTELIGALKHLVHSYEQHPTDISKVIIDGGDNDPRRN